MPDNIFDAAQQMTLQRSKDISDNPCRQFLRLNIEENTMAATKRSGKKSSRRKYGKAAGKSVESAMRRRQRGTLKSGRGGKVKSRKQAIAIGLSEARKKGAKVPSKKAA
jgi:hypothetical protein